MNVNISSGQSIDIQGHRGARGLLPENSINGFIKATDLGVTTLELDVVISKDLQVVISHEPFMSPTICLDADGQAFEDESQFNIYTMDYEDIRKFDCGIKGNPNFTEQEKVTTYKPLLGEMLDIVESHIKKNNLKPVNYNIEIKSSEKGDKIAHPEPAKFADLVYAEIKAHISLDRVTIQSFDTRPLQYLHKKDPQLTLAFLVESKLNFKRQLKLLGFNPDIYSPYFQLLDQHVVEKIQKMGIKVIPWTINDTATMEIMLEWGVDGIITDYPDRALDLIRQSAN